MDPKAALAILQELRRQHGEAMASCGDRLYSDIEKTLRMLPESGTWAIARPSPAVYARTKDGTLFLVTVSVDDDHVALTSRRVSGSRVGVCFEWGKAEPDETGGLARRTRWTFRFDEDETGALEPLTTIEGTVTKTTQGESLDPLEELAREIASDAGWEFAG